MLLSIGGGQKISEKYLFLYLYDELKADEKVLGLSVVSSILMEIPMLNYGKYFSEKIGIYNMLFLSIITRSL